jgi:hypothetical protein
VISTTGGLPRIALRLIKLGIETGSQIDLHNIANIALSISDLHGIHERLYVFLVGSTLRKQLKLLIVHNFLGV